MRFGIRKALIGVFLALVGVAVFFPVTVTEAGTVQYRYDELDRLYQAEYDDGTIIEYVYDNVGNRLEKRTQNIDLAVTGVSGPAEAHLSQTVTISTTVSNQGGSPSLPFHVGIYLSPNQVIGDGDDYLLAQIPVVGLSGSSQATLNTSIQIPPSIPVGTYNLGTIADTGETVTEYNENNNAFKGDPIIIITSLPDLSVTAVSGPSRLSIQQMDNVSVTMRNGGTASGAFSVGVYLSADNTISSANDRLIGTSAVSGLDFLSEASLVVGVQIPSDVTPGTYYLGAIADRLEEVTESNETDNALAGNSVVIMGTFSGLISRWSFDNCDAHDDSGNNHNGTVYNDPACVNGIAGKAFSFDGTNDYILVPHPGALSQGTISGWVNYSSTYAPSVGRYWFVLAAKAMGQHGDDVNFGVHPYFSNTIRFGIYVPGLGWQWANSGMLPEVAVWKHFVGTWGPGGIKIYINGVLKATNTSYTSGTPSGGTTPTAIIGADTWDSYFNGIIDEVQIYNRALTQEEITSLAR